MTNLVSLEINYESEEPRILGRNLHRILEISTDYSHWIRRMFEYGFIEDIDYFTEIENVYRKDGRKMPQIHKNYYLSIPMAIQICMVQKTEIGKKVREFYISNYKLPEKELLEELVRIIQENKDIKNLDKYLYILEMSSKLVKIGVTNNLDRRIKSLQNSSGFIVSRQYSTGLLSSNRAFQLESILHNKFKEYRKEGEYFEVDFDLVVSKLNEILKGDN